MTETTPEALRLARIMRDGTSFANEDYTQTADMLERQHARIAELEAQLEAIGAGGVEPLRSRRCLHQIAEPGVAPEHVAPAVPDQWLDIETAPKDGRTLLLGYRNSHGKWRTVRGKWMSVDYIAEHWEDPDDAEPGWFETAVEAEDPPNCWHIKPTHWMSLPGAPAAQAPAVAGDAQPVAAQETYPQMMPAELSQFLSDVMTAAGLVSHGKQCKALGERLGDACMRLRLHCQELFAAPVAAQAPRPCTCHPDDRPDGPCREKYAASECQAPEHLLYRLRKHADDDRNSAFARSTMREALQYLEAAQAEKGGA